LSSANDGQTVWFSDVWTWVAMPATAENGVENRLVDPEIVL
jgi:hypothetical protein